MAVEYAREADSPAISVVIPSIPDNDHSITTRHLAEQEFDEEYEVVVVNDASLDRSEARNLGLRRARAEIVALTDDDCKPPVDWLASIHREFADDPDLVCLEGAVYGGSRYQGSRHYVGCNLAVQREAALAVGGFSSRYATWREDTEFGWRMERDASGECRYSDAVRMCHPTVPRTPIDRHTERLLRAEYPKRYEEVLNATLFKRLRRRARTVGLTRYVNRLRNVLSRPSG